jgi:hypothetical protein
LKVNKPLKQMSDKRRDKLAEQGITHPGSTLAARKPAMRTSRPVDTGPDRAAVDAVLERDHWSCVVCGGALHGQRGRDWSIHHRINRSQGGDNRLSNLIAVCGDGTSGCHGELGASPAKAREAGWSLRSTDVPAECVIAHSQHGFVRLTDDGRWV